MKSGMGTRSLVDWCPTGLDRIRVGQTRSYDHSCLSQTLTGLIILLLVQVFIQGDADDSFGVAVTPLA